jgi:hypothetical protein
MDRDALMADAIIGLLDDSAVAADLPGGESYALASLFGEEWGDAMEETLEAVANIDDRPIPELKACCCNNCLTDFFVNHPTTARNAFTTTSSMTELKAELGRGSKGTCPRPLAEGVYAVSVDEGKSRIA